MPDIGTVATIAPLRRQSEQSQRRGSTMPSGRSSSRTTFPQWQEARCLGLMSVPPTFLTMFVSACVRQRVLVVERTQCCCYQRRDHFCRNTQTNAATSQPRPIHGIRETNVHTAALIRHNSMAKAPTSMFPMNSLDYSFCSRENVRCGLTLSSAVPEGQPLKRRAGR